MKQKYILKSLFSQRQGIVQAQNFVTTNALPKDVENAIRTCYHIYCATLDQQEQPIYNRKTLKTIDVERELWIHFRNEPIDTFANYSKYYTSFVPILEDPHEPWNRKLDMLEYVIKWSRIVAKEHDIRIEKIVDGFVSELNSEFDRLDYGYRIINDMIVNITSEEEKECIEKAIEESTDNVRTHFESALKNYSLKPEPNIRESIKESISAVEAVCREYTGLSSDSGTLGKALDKLEKEIYPLHPALKAAFEKLYVWTNSKDTGIRHCLMDKSGTYEPSKDEAYLMIIQCTAFVNYIRMKLAKK